MPEFSEIYNTETKIPELAMPVTSGAVDNWGIMYTTVIKFKSPKQTKSH